MLKFRIWYGDGTWWTGDPFKPKQRYDAQFLVQEGDTARGYNVDYGKDYYFYRNGVWVGGDAGGLWDYLAMYDGPQSVILGRTMVRNQDFWDLKKKASELGLEGL